MSASPRPPVTVQQVEPRRIAAATARFTRQTLPRVLIELLDRVYAVLAEQPDVRRACNIALYEERGTLTAGVEVDATFRASGDVFISATPSGRAANATHVGPYAAMARANDAIAAWCRAHGEAFAGPSWEVYGDWDEDESRLRTDVYYLLR